MKMWEGERERRKEKSEEGGREGATRREWWVWREGEVPGWTLKGKHRRDCWDKDQIPSQHFITHLFSQHLVCHFPVRKGTMSESATRGQAWYWQRDQEDEQNKKVFSCSTGCILCFATIVQNNVLNSWYEFCSINSGVQEHINTLYPLNKIK